MIQVALDNYDGNLIGNMGYTYKEATEAVSEGQLEAVAFGNPFIANPDLVKRFEKGLPLANADSSTLYTHEAKGYTDYQFV